MTERHGGLPRQVATQPTIAELAVARADFLSSDYALTVGCVAPLVAAALLQLGPRHHAMHWPATALLLLTAAVIVMLRQRQNKSGEKDRDAITALGVFLAGVALAVLSYVGPFTSGAIILAPLVCAYAFARTDVRAGVILATCIIGYTLVAILALAGAIDTTQTVIGFEVHRPLTIVVLTLFTHCVLVVTFLVARKERGMLLDALNHMNGAYQQLEQREAELLRARADLDRAVAEASVGRLTGKRVAGYEVGEVLGRGGMGEVYRAWPRDGAPIALKVLNESMAQSPVHVERFFREASVCSELDSAPHRQSP